jgi:hypothetical protein
MSRAPLYALSWPMQPAASRVQLASNEALTSTAGCTAPQALRQRLGQRTSRKALIRCSSTVLAANLHQFRAAKLCRATLHFACRAGA